VHYLLRARLDRASFLAKGAFSSVLLALLLGSTAVHAEIESRDVGRSVLSVEINGIGDAVRTDLRAGLELIPRRGLLGMDRARLERSAVGRDVDRILLYMARRGFPSASVTPEVVDRSSDGVRLRLTVDTGSPVVVAGVPVRGYPESLERPETALRVGARFRDADVASTRRALQRALAEGGYARARIERRLERVAQDSVRVIFEVTDTARYRFDGFEPRGVDGGLLDLARRAVADPTDRTFTPAILESARRDLRELGVFRQARVRANESGPETLRLIAQLTPRDMQTLSFGVGTWTDHPIQLTSSWRHRNLFGGGRGVGVGGEFALNRSEAYSFVNWPLLLRRRSESRIATRYRIEDEEAYGSEELVLSLDHRFRVGNRTSWSVATSWTTTTLDIRTDDPTAFETVPGQQALLEVRWIMDGVNDLLDPTDGRRLQFEAWFAPPFSFADATFYSLRGGWAEIMSLGQSTVLATRLDLASARPVGDSVDLLPTQRWFGGGFNTHRGAPRRGLGPTDSENDPLGGQWRGLAGVELRQRFNDWAGLALFVDTGQVWAVADDMGFDDLVVAVGGGPMISTPIGPLHLDFAWNVAERPADGSNWVFNFGIGHAY